MDPRKLKEYRDKGRKALTNREFTIARQYFEMILDDNPQDEEALDDMEKLAILRAASWNFFKRWLVELNARILQLFGMSKKVVDDTEALWKSKRNSARLASLYGACAVKSGRFAGASEALRQLGKIRSDSISVWKRLAYALEMNQDFKEAASVWSRLRAMRPDNADFERSFKNVSAQAYSKEGVPEHLTEKRALEEKEKLDKADPEYIRQEAMKLKELADQRPEDKRAQLRFARKIAEAGDFEEAIVAYEKVITLAPDDKKLLNEFAGFLKSQKLWDKALEQLNILLEKDPENNEIILEMNRLKQTRLEALLKEEPESEEFAGQLEELRTEEKQIMLNNTKLALEKNPNDLDLLIQVSQLYIDLGRLDDAIPHLQKTSKIPQRMFVACKMLGDCFKQKGIHEVAIEQYEKALTVAPKRPAGLDKRVKDIFYNLGEIYLEIENREKAIKYIKDLYEEDISYKDIKDKYEALYTKRDDSEEEESVLEHIEENEDKDKEAPAS